jgi:hypothetical protein
LVSQAEADRIRTGEAPPQWGGRATPDIALRGPACPRRRLSAFIDYRDASDTLVAHMDPGVFEQITNVACLPGIVRAAL